MKYILYDFAKAKTKPINFEQYVKPDNLRQGLLKLLTVKRNEVYAVLETKTSDGVTPVKTRLLSTGIISQTETRYFFRL
jgi:hypothetical protein